MEAERDRVAKELRSQGAEAAERIRADADRQRTVILAEAYREAEHIRGEGDASAAEIYAKAYNKNPEFYGFYRSINAYQSSFNNKSDVMVLDPDTDFFKYFNSMKGGGK
jgi:membrane protease subunit HflC